MDYASTTKLRIIRARLFNVPSMTFIEGERLKRVGDLVGEVFRQESAIATPLFAPFQTGGEIPYAFPSYVLVSKLGWTNPKSLVEYDFARCVARPWLDWV